MNRDYCVVIDNGGNVYKVKQQTMTQCFDKIITPLDIISQVSYGRFILKSFKKVLNRNFM